MESHTNQHYEDLSGLHLQKGYNQKKHMQTAKVLALSKSDSHTFNKFNCDAITLQEGLGVAGDAQGATMKHRSRVAVMAAISC